MQILCILTVAILIGLFVVDAQRDYYEILGLNRDASDADIKKAYKKLAMQFHPDKNKEEGAEAQFMEVTNAYEILSDPDNRKKYDMYGHAAFNQGGGARPGQGGVKFNFGDPFEIFRTFFGGGGGDGGEGVKFSFNFGGDQSGGFPGGGFGGGFPGGGGFQGGGFPGGGRQQQHHQQQPQQPQQPLYTQNTEVTLLTADTFPLFVTESSNAWLIKFFSNECSHCHELSPVYEKVASSLKHIVNVGAVNCGNSKKICENYDIQKVPEIILIPYGKENRENYKRFTGEKTAIKIHDFALTALPHNYVTILKLHTEYNDFLSSDTKPKIILFSKKTSPPPLFISLSLLFKDVVKMGFVSRASAAGKILESEHSVSEWPSIIALAPSGTEKESYSGEITYPSLSIFINKFIKTCKKKEMPLDIVYEFNPNNFNKECGTGLCGIYISESETLQNSDDIENLNKLVSKYVRQKCKIGYIGISGGENLRGITSENAKFVVYNGKSGKIAWTTDATQDGFVALLDRVFGGSEKWTKLDTPLKPWG